MVLTCCDIFENTFTIICNHGDKLFWSLEVILTLGYLSVLGML